MERQKVYDALDALPELVFAAYCVALSGLNKVVAATILDDPTPAATLDAAMKPFTDLLG